MTKRVFLAGILMVMFLPSSAAPGKPYVLATYGDRFLSTSDLQFYLAFNHPTFAHLELTPEYFAQEEIAEEKVLKEILSEMAFCDLLYGEDHDTARGRVLEHHVHSQVRDYVVKAQLLPKLRNQISISDEEIKAYYQQHQEEFQVPERVKMSFIFLAPSFQGEKPASRERLAELQSKADFVENFQAYAKEYSMSPSAERGGVVDYFPRGTYSPEIENVVFALKEGEISEILERDKGFYIFKCLDRQQPTFKDLDEVREEIRRSLTEARFEKTLSEKIEALKAKYNPSIWSAESVPASSDTVLSVGAYQVTSAALSSVYRDQLRTEGLPSLLERLLANELLFQEALETKAAQDPQFARNVERLRNHYFAERYLKREFNREVGVTDDEVSEFYERRKELYHTPTSKEVEYVLFKVAEQYPTAGRRRAALEESRRLAEAFRAQWGDRDATDEMFVEVAKESATDAIPVEFKSLGMVRRLPPEWGLKNALFGNPVGYTSRPVKTEGGYLVYRVTREGKYDLLPFEQVKDKVYRVLHSQKYDAYRQEWKKRLLDASGYRETF